MSVTIHVNSCSNPVVKIFFSRRQCILKNLGMMKAKQMVSIGHNNKVT